MALRFHPCPQLVAVAVMLLNGCATPLDPTRPQDGASAAPSLAAAASASSAARPVSAVALAAAPRAAAARTEPPPPGTSPPPRPPAGASAPGMSAVPGVSPIASAPAAMANTAVAPPAPGQPPPFAVVIKDAKKIDGLFTLYQKDEKVWIELKPEDFDKSFFLSPKISSGIGEGRIFGGIMVGRGGRFGRAQVVEFQKVYQQVRLVARNQQFIADAGTPQARAVAAGFSDSLLASSMVVSQPHPERKTVLIEAAPLFLGDMLGIGSALQRAYRQGYSLDGRHSHFASVRGLPDQVVFDVKAHFASPSLSTFTPGAPPGVPAPILPSTLPDARSMFIGLLYSLAKLPDEVMRTRRADPRVGYFSTDVSNFSIDSPTTRQRYVDRWRLEKKDPAATSSEPVKPIVFWIDRSVPLKYREAVTRGIMEWNKAFDKIGFKDAIQARQQPDDASFDTLDVGVASVRFIATAEPAFDGFGPSVTDPRSGEILDADIVLDENLARNMRGLRAQVITRVDPSGDHAPGGADDMAALMQFGSPARRAALQAARHFHADGMLCEYGAHAAEAYGYALDVLESRGDLGPDSPLPEQFAADRVFAVTVHEVGHALGLRHNFRSSRAYSMAQLADPVFTAAHGTTGSVMDYPALNLPPPGVPFDQHGAVHRGALGAYDYWAIEYAYKPLAAADEVAELRRIAARSHEPLLAYGTDEDNALGIDPESLTFDLGDDPVAFANSRFAIAKDLIERQEGRRLSEDANYLPLRRAVRYAVRDVAAAAGILARQIGGVRTLRDYPGSGRDPLQPVPAAQQREALDALARHVLSADALRLSPALQRRLAPDFEARHDDASQATEYSISEAVIAMQRALLSQLMSDTLAARILDSEGKFDAPGGGAPNPVFHLSELYSRLTREIWSELDHPRAEVSANRRELQREHLNRLAAQLLRPASQSRADARALLRAEARALLPRLVAAQKRPGLDAQSRAHWVDAVDTLTTALAAPLQRQGI